jgi:plastocyanin
MTRAIRTTLTLAVATLTACGGSGGYGSPTSPPPGNDRTITASASLAFGPASLAVTAGDTVTFAFGSVPHNVFFDPQAGAPSDIGGLNANVSITRAFATPGTYHYSCHIHPSMRGTVVVR